MIPDSTHRVEENTPGALNQRIRRSGEDFVARALATGRPGIDRRLAQLDREWDIERVLEANAASVALAGLVAAALLDRRLLIVPALVAGFLMQHAVQGWCPPVPIFRRLGFRTPHEIAEERHALKQLRGDYRAGSPEGSAREAARAALAAARA